MTIEDDLVEHEVRALRGLEKMLKEKLAKREHRHDQSDIEMAFDADKVMDRLPNTRGFEPEI